MNDAPTLFLAWLAGCVIGAIFFGGLWWTVRKVVSTRQPALWLVGSLILRTGIALAGFHLVWDRHWERLLLCLLGFVMARLVVTWVARPWGRLQARPAREVSHAP